jgi:diguanylate cyclase (GGDEF)-like protein/PAS domain S-box-containing protein
LTGVRPKLLPWLVLASSLCLTWLVWDYERQTTREQLRSQFDFSLREAGSRIDQHIATYGQMLRGALGVLTFIDKRERDALSAYFTSLQFDPDFSGIEVIGVAELVPGDRKDAHVAAMRRLGFSDYAILPEGRRDIYVPIVQSETHTVLNSARPGFDTWFDPVWRSAMEGARDSGMMAISGKVMLGADTGVPPEPSFLMFLPIFAQDKPHDSVALRRANLTGWIFASIRVTALMGSLYGGSPPGVIFTIYDGVELSDANILYRSSDQGSQGRSAAIANNEYLLFAGHTWTLSARTSEDFESRFGHKSPTLIAAGGTGLSLLLALLAWLMATGKARAQQLAERMTKDLRTAIIRKEETLEYLSEALDFNRTILLNSPVPTGVYAAGGRCILANEAYAKLVGASREALLEKNFRAIVPDQQSELLKDCLIALDQQTPQTCEVNFVTSFGKEVWIEAQILPTKLNGEDHLLIQWIDLTERKRVEEELRHMAFQDSLTQLPNRRLLLDRLKQASRVSKREGSHLAVLFIDLDKFKQLNDTHGHDVGDQLLIEIARRLQRSVRGSDTIARLGGDEFVVLLEGLGPEPDKALEYANFVADKIRQSLREEYVLGDILYHGSASVGIQLVLGDTDDPDQILKGADAAMYEVKKSKAT